MKRELARPPDDQLRRAPAGLARCEQCGELYGWALFRDPPRQTTCSAARTSCLCEGVVCADCGQRSHRPISNHYDEAADTLWHVPSFMVHRCR
jgi:hypothetical protein